MKKFFGLFILASVLLTIGFASATAVAQTRCNGGNAVDLCTWTTSGDPDNGLPLGSGEENAPQCGLGHNTLWPIGSVEDPSFATATCVFDGSNLADVMLYISVDNDIVSCTLNGNEVLGYQIHGGCAPLDPMNGYSQSLTVIPGQNTLVCTVKDYGVMSHFDACVLGTPTTPTVPEFGTTVGILTAIAAVSVFFFVRRSK